jgi:hypothetical protein
MSPTQAQPKPNPSPTRAQPKPDLSVRPEPEPTLIIQTRPSPSILSAIYTKNDFVVARQRFGKCGHMAKMLS